MTSWNWSWRNTRPGKTVTIALCLLPGMRTGHYAPAAIGRKATINSWTAWHEGKTLEMTEVPEEIIEHRTCFYTECGKDLNNQAFMKDNQKKLALVILVASEQSSRRAEIPKLRDRI